MVTGIHYLMRYEAGLSDTGRQMVERVHGAGGRLGRLLDELEHAAWIEGRPPGPLVAEPCRLSALVEGALGKLERSVTQHQVAVRVEVPRDLPPVEGDAELYGQALEYVLDFAVARSPGRAVEVRAEGPAALSVRDEGGPVDDPTLARLFVPFVENDLIPRPAPGARRRERLGLGLSIARGMLAAQGGSLDAAVGPDRRGLVLAVRLRG
jgi:K+-sensing histidine kinase KdpD